MTTASTASRAGFRRLLAIVSAVLLALAFSLQTIPASAAMTEEQLNAQQKELEKATDENAVLEEQVTALEKENDRLRADYDTLYAAVDAQSKKLRFMDSYVVFVEDDGTGNYHRYDCGKFSKKNFWAYSRKLAERQGYTPCAQCFGS